MTNPIEAKLRITAETAQAGAAVDQLGKKTTGLATTLDKTGTAKPFDGLKTGATEAEKAHTTAQKAVQRTADETARKLRETQQQMRLLGPQITDIVTGLATGQSPFTVLLQQGGQLRDVFGSSGAALKALGSIFTTARVVIGATAAALASVAFYALQGANESDNLRKSLALSGNEAGRTVGNLNELALRVAQSQKAAIGSVRETVQEVVDSGQFVGATLDSAVRATTALNKLTGATAGEAVKQFSTLTAGVTAGAAKLNQAYNFLTADQVKYIRSLEAQGLAQEAIRFTLDQLSQTIEQRSVPAVGLLERAWIGVKNAVSGALDAIKEIGRDDTAEKLVKNLEARIKIIRDRQAKGFGAVQLPELEAQLAAQKALLRAQAQAADISAEASKTEQDKIAKQTKAFRDQLAAVDLAGAQKLLAQRLASLDAQRNATERAYDAGLTSAEANALALNRIDQARLQAQETNLRRQIEIEDGRVVEKPEDGLAKKARVSALEAQLVELNDRIQQTVSKGTGLVEAAALDRARSNATEWAAIWQRAELQIKAFSEQLAASRAKLLSDPIRRADSEAAAAGTSLRQQIADLERDLQLRIGLTIDPAQRAELERQLAELRRQAAQVVTQRDREARFGSLNTQAGERQGQLQLEEARVEAQVQAGQLTTAQGEQRILDLRREQVPALERIATAMRALADSPEQKQQVDRLEEQIRLQKDFQGEIERTARSSAVNSLSTALGDIVTGAKTGKEALLDMVGSFTRALLDVLNRRLAEQLLNQFTSALPGGGSGGGFFKAIGSFFGFHAGGVVGQAGAMRISADPRVFALAPRYHGGGIAGLMPDEVPAILKRGEEVLTKDDPRHRRNRGRAGPVSISVEVNGATGSNADLTAGGVDLAASLQPAVESVISAWSIRQMRPGGLFDGLR